MKALRLKRFFRLKKGKEASSADSLATPRRKKGPTRILVSLIILLLLWLYLEIVNPLPPRTIKPIAGAKLWSGSLARAEMLPYSVYERALRRRKLFHPIVRKKPSTPAPSLTIEQMAEPLVLLGIISVGDRVEASINDRKSKKSYLCRGGETVGGLKVEEVLKDKVVLSYGNDKIELKL